MFLKSGSSDRFYFRAPKSLRRVTSAMKLKDPCSLKVKQDKPRWHIKKQRHHFADKGLYSQSYGFPVFMYRCESWTIKKAECQRIDDFELWYWRRLLSPLDCKEIKAVNSKGNQPWIFTGRTQVEDVATIYTKKEQQWHFFE